MNQAELQLLVKGLRMKVGKARRIPNDYFYGGGLLKTRSNVSALITHERLELSENNGLHARLYSERLISDAITYGPKHKHTMEMATWWLNDNKESIHKLFEVLVPRFADYSTAYTRAFVAPPNFEIGSNVRFSKDRVVVELKGHPFPKLAYSNSRPNRNHIHNILLSEAKKDLRISQVNKLVEKSS